MTESSDSYMNELIVQKLETCKKSALIIQMYED